MANGSDRTCRVRRDAPGWNAPPGFPRETPTAKRRATVVVAGVAACLATAILDPAPVAGAPAGDGAASPALARLGSADGPAADTLAGRLSDPDDPWSDCRHPWEIRTAVPGDAFREFRRLAQMAGRAPLRSEFLRRPSDAQSTVVCGGFWNRPWGGRRPLREGPTTGEVLVELLPVRARGIYNSGYPNDRNDGAAWAGKGWTATGQFGVRAAWDFGWGRLSGAARPSFNWQENEDHLTYWQWNGTAINKLNYPFHRENIDWPLRMGFDPYWNNRLEQSYLRLDAFGFKAGVSNENLWRGPALRYPLLLSNTAGGFPHLFVGTSRPVDVGIGRLEAEFFWGELEESEHFDPFPENDTRTLNTGTVVFSPAFAPGLSLGVSSFYMNTIPPEGLPTSEYFGFADLPVSSGGGGATPGNGLATLFGRWAFPAVGFEVYAEWGRNDFAADVRDFVDEPDHSQAYMLGFQKVWGGGEPWVRLAGELIHLQSPITVVGRQAVSVRDDDLRPPVPWYTHASVRQGHTHRGQLLGAFVGPGSFAQFLGTDLYASWGEVGVWVERVRRDDDAYYFSENLDEVAAFRGHDTELSAAVEGTLFLRELGLPGFLKPVESTDLSLAVTYGSRRNRNFIGIEPRPRLLETLRTEPNWRLEMGLTWWPEAPELRLRP